MMVVIQMESWEAKTLQPERNENKTILNKKENAILLHLRKDNLADIQPTKAYIGFWFRSKTDSSGSVSPQLTIQQLRNQ